MNNLRLNSGKMIKSLVAYKRQIGKKASKPEN